MYLHDFYNRAIGRRLFNKIVTLARRYADMVLVERVILRGLTVQDGEVQAVIDHPSSPFCLHSYPVGMIEELQP